MKKIHLVSLLLVYLLLQAAPLAAQPVVDHPEKLTFKPLAYQPPKAKELRHVLQSGSVVFIAEDRELPLINVSILVRTGDYLEPKEKAGLAAMVGALLRDGGTTTLTPDSIDEKIDFLAANSGASISSTQGNASLNILSKDFDAGMALLVDMMKNPRFDEARMKLYKERTLQNMQRRNDQTASIEGREWGRLMYGENFFTNHLSTKASLESITRQDLIDFHKRYYYPANFILAVSGDFNKADLLKRLDKHFAGWKSTRAAVPKVPRPSQPPKPGIYMVNKDVNQGRISIGHWGVERGNSDEFALAVMNDILGGGGFTSRITSKVRSDEGLAYSAGSNFGIGVYYPGVFRAAFQSKSPTCAHATKIVLDEIARMRTEKVTDDELKTSVNSFVETFPLNFATKAQVVGTFAADEYTGRDPLYWETYRDNIRKVTADDVLRVAQKYLQPDKLVILGVGNTKDILAGYDKVPVKFADFGLGEAKTIPLRDPMTLAPMAEGVK
jgi:predicted Zn-dependent peptidase